MLHGDLKKITINLSQTTWALNENVKQYLKVMFMLIAGGRGKEKRGKKRAIFNCSFSLLCFLHRLCSKYLLKIKCVFKFRTLFISSKTLSFQGKDKDEKFGLVLV